jgi:hypothetical protein
MKSNEKWWAHEDSNLGQTDYEAVELEYFLFRKPKTCYGFSFSEPSNLTETEINPNRTTKTGSPELRKWQIPKSFL